MRKRNQKTKKNQNAIDKLKTSTIIILISSGAGFGYITTLIVFQAYAVYTPWMFIWSYAIYFYFLTLNSFFKILSFTFNLFKKGELRKSRLKTIRTNNRTLTNQTNT